MIEYMIVSSIFLIGLSYYSFYKLTIKKKDITILKKYNLKYDDTHYMIIDNNENIYKISSCFWKLKDNQMDLWNKIEENKKYRITYYGFDITTLNMHHEIIDIERL